MSRTRPRVRTWRRTLRALALTGRARAALSGADDGGADTARSGLGGAGGNGEGLLHLSPARTGPRCGRIAVRWPPCGCCVPARAGSGTAG